MEFTEHTRTNRLKQVETEAECFIIMDSYSSNGIKGLTFRVRCKKLVIKI